MLIRAHQRSGPIKWISDYKGALIGVTWTIVVCNLESQGHSGLLCPMIQKP